MAIKILTFDPGSSFTGWCLLYTPGSIVQMPGGPVDIKNFKNPLWGTVPADGNMATQIRTMIENAKPNILACEKSFPPKGTAVYSKNWEKTAEVRGVIKSFVRPGMQFFELTAGEVRSALKVPRLERRRYNVNKIKGLGGLTQDARVKRALCTLTGIADTEFKTSHEVDAVALAYIVCSRLCIPWK